jgi:hypothetical protein
LWARTTQSVNACGVSLLTVDDIRKKWDDLKWRTKAKAAQLNKETSVTGGGKRVRIELTNLERRILSLLGETRVKGMKGAIDTARSTFSVRLL